MKFPPLLLFVIHIFLTTGLVENDVYNTESNNDNAFRLEETLNYDELFDQDFENLLKNDAAVSFHPVGELSLLNQNVSLESLEQETPLQHKTNHIRLTSVVCPRFDR